MIAQVTFTATIKSGKKKSVQTDTIHIHSVELDDAKSTFQEWITDPKVVGIRGIKMFHPLSANGSIKLSKVVELHE